MSRYADAAREIRYLRERADAIRTRAASPASSKLDGMPRAPGFAGDKLGGIIGAADALEREADEKEQDAAALYAEMDGAIRKIGGKHGGETSDRTAMPIPRRSRVVGCDLPTFRR